MVSASDITVVIAILMITSGSLGFSLGIMIGLRNGRKTNHIPHPSNLRRMK